MRGSSARLARQCSHVHAKPDRDVPDGGIRCQRVRSSVSAATTSLRGGAREDRMPAERLLSQRRRDRDLPAGQGAENLAIRLRPPRIDLAGDHRLGELAAHQPPQELSLVRPE